MSKKNNKQAGEAKAKRGGAGGEGVDGVKAMGVRERMAELKAKIEWFDGDEFEFEEALGRYREVLELAKAIEVELEQLKNEVVKIEKDFTKR